MANKVPQFILDEIQSSPNSEETLQSMADILAGCGRFDLMMSALEEAGVLHEETATDRPGSRGISPVRRMVTEWQDVGRE